MQKNYKLSTGFLLLVIFWSHAVFAQLPAFTLNVTPQHEECIGNGSLNFTVSGTATGSSVLYNIYKFPNLTSPIATVATNSLGGLTAGDYRVIATQTLAGVTNTQQQDATILFTHVDLAYSVDLESCGGSSTITIEVTQGTGTLFEIFSGPVTFPPQASNVFTGLPDGNYQIRVFDNCGGGYASPFSLTSVSGGFTIAQGTAFQGPLVNCNTIIVNNSVVASAGNSLLYPLSLQYTVYPPAGGAPVIVNGTVSMGSGSNVTAVSTIPFYYGQQYSYDLTVTDACGNIYTVSNNVIEETILVSVSDTPMECSSALIVAPSYFVGPITIDFTDAPDGFDPTMFNPTHPGPFLAGAEYYNPDVPLPVGNYTVSITDACGNTTSQTILFDPVIEVLPLSYSGVPGCDLGFGSIGASSANGDLVSVIITSAPDEFEETLPFDATFNIADGGFFMDSLPAGNYEIHTVDQCGHIRDTPFTVTGYQFNFGATVTQGCSTFDLLFNFSSNLNVPRKFYLQKLDPITGNWGHPVSGATGPVPDNDTAVALSNNVINMNLPYQGTFRIMLTFESIQSGSVLPRVCIQELYTFESGNMLSVDNIVAYSCDPTSYDVIVEATGFAPLLYRITMKDGVPFLVENGTSNLFTNLLPGVYLFEVEDSCGNVQTRYFDTTDPFTYLVTATGFCDGQDGALSVPAFSFINYEWWHESDPSTIISTSPILEFSPLDVATDTGVYYVRIYAPDTTPSCIDFTLSYEITAEGTLPDAGSDVLVAYCGNPGMVNLFELLDDATDTSGTWENSDGVLLTNPFWDATSLEDGNYSFTYTVNGWCGVTDSASVQFVFSTVPQAPVASSETDACATNNLQLFADGDPAYGYYWTGPNGFTSDDQNPILENISTMHSGTYTVVSISNGCASEPSSVEVVVGGVVPFIVEGGCDNNIYVLEAIASSEPFAPDTVFSWSGPEGFSSTQNPVAINGLPAGVYSVTATSTDGCTLSENFTVGGTACGIPLGISPNDDGNNDTFNLSGLNVRELKIFNRYGMVVYEKLNYIKEWDGRDQKGNELPTATYFYLAKFETGEQKTGWVYLLR